MSSDTREVVGSCAVGISELVDVSRAGSLDEVSSLLCVSWVEDMDLLEVAGSAHRETWRTEMTERWDRNSDERKRVELSMECVQVPTPPKRGHSTWHTMS